MEKAVITIHTKIFYFKTQLTICFLGIFLGLPIAAYIVSLEHRLIGLSFALLVTLGPIIIFNISNILRRKVIIQFHEGHFIIKIMKLKHTTAVKQYEYEYSDVKGVIISPTSTAYSRLTLKLHNGNNKEYLFQDEKVDNKLPENSMSEIVYKHLRSFNKEIELLPPFFATTKGTASIIGLTTLLLFTMMFFVFQNQTKVMPYSFLISIGMFLQLIATRKRHIAVYKKMKNDLGINGAS